MKPCVGRFTGREPHPHKTLGVKVLTFDFCSVDSVESSLRPGPLIPRDDTLETLRGIGETTNTKNGE